MKVFTHLCIAMLACLEGVYAQAVAPRTLADFEKLAIERNPLVGEARAAVTAASGRAKQSGLYPNPVVSAVGEHISSGPIIRGGEYGGSVQQRIVTAGKLGLNRKAAEQEVAVSEEGAKADRQRVLNAVRSLYYQALADQFRVDVRTNLSRLAQEAVRISGELMNVGLADQPDRLVAEVEADRIALELSDAKEHQQKVWRQLAATLNVPTLQPVHLDDDLEKIPRIDYDQTLARVLSESPEVHAASIEVTRAGLLLDRAKREKIPDLMLAGGVRYNRELLEASAPNILRAVGSEGFFEVGMELPLFNRNQGNVAAARADAERAKLQVERTKLSLGSRLAEVYAEYKTAIDRVDRYKQEMLPRAERAYQMYFENFRQLAGAYSPALAAQRSLFQLQDSYADALTAAWERSVEMQGLLLRE